MFLDIPGVFRAGIVIAIVFWLGLVVFPSLPQVRAVLSAPLVVSDPNAAGDACYVLAGGTSLWERLNAAADLVQMGRVSRIFLLEDGSTGPYSFKFKSSLPRSRWIRDYLTWRGVAAEKVSFIPHTTGPFGTLAEARAFAKYRPREVNTLVIVSSAPHMRRSLLAFSRTLPREITVIPYAATLFPDSYEMHHPIWLEYVKLLIYHLLC